MALNIKTGEVIGRCFQRRRTAEFVKFLDDMAARLPDKEIHAIVDNLSTHARDEIDKWLATSQGHIHYTPKESV